MFEIAEEKIVNPNYHKASDTVATLNLKFHAEVTRATLAALVELASKP